MRKDLRHFAGEIEISHQASGALNEGWGVEVGIVAYWCTHDNDVVSPAPCDAPADIAQGKDFLE